MLIIADDVGVEQIGAYREGTDPATTPNIDALAARGVLFRNTWSNPVCSSTRATILTGRYGFRTGVGFVAQHGAELRDRENTLPEMLSRHPYARYGSAAFGKWHLNAGQSWEADEDILAAPHRAGFSMFRGVYANIVGGYEGWRDVVVTERENGRAQVEGGRHNSNYNTSEIVNHAAEWIHDFEERRHEDPWFVWLAFNAAHAPFHKPPQDLHTQDLSAPGLSCSNPPPYDDPGNLQPCYQAMIEAMDTEIGRLIEREISPESLSRTTVIFVGDNGSPEGSAVDGPGAGRAKGTPYEGGVNVPLIVAGAGVERSKNGKGRESRVLVNTTDLFATVLELAGIDVDATVPSRFRPTPRKASAASDPRTNAALEITLDSQSLLPHLQRSNSNAPEQARRFVYTELFRRGLPDDRWPVSNAVRDTRGFKLIRFFEASARNWREELYDLESDPFEQKNLLGLPMTEALHQTHQTLRDHLNNIRSTGWQPHGEEMRK